MQLKFDEPFIKKLNNQNYYKYFIQYTRNINKL